MAALTPAAGSGNDSAGAADLGPTYAARHHALRFLTHVIDGHPAGSALLQAMPSSSRVDILDVLMPSQHCCVAILYGHEL